LMLPLFVIAYKRSVWGGHILCLMTSLVSYGLCCWVILKYSLRAGPLAEENWYLFAYIFQKPWFKLGSACVGITYANLYMDILKYRRLANEAERKEKYPKLFYFHHANILQGITLLVCLASILFCLLIGHSAIAKPYSWTMAENAAFMTVLRALYSWANITVIVVIFCGGATFLKAFFSRPFFLVLGKLTYTTSLITPLMIQLIYSQLPNGLFVSFNKVIELGVGNVICVMAAGLVLFLFFEFPMHRMLQWTVYPKISADSAKHTYYTSLYE
jgi:hypothetical protein